MNLFATADTLPASPRPLPLLHHTPGAPQRSNRRQHTLASMDFQDGLQDTEYARRGGSIRTGGRVRRGGRLELPWHQPAGARNRSGLHFDVPTFLLPLSFPSQFTGSTLCALAQGTPVPYARSPRPTVANAPTPTASCVAVPANLIVPSEFGTLPVLLPSPGGSTASAACATSIPYLAARVPDGAAPARARHAPSFSLFLNFLYLLSFIAAAISVGWMQRDSLLGTDAWWDTVDTGST